MTSDSAEAVAFVINAFERNIEEVTAPGFLTHAAAQHNHRFASRTLLVNNVADPEEARRRCQAALDRGEIDEFVFVDERLDAALRALKLRRRDFGRYIHWSDCCAVALTLDGPDLLCYVDVDLDLRGSAGWIEEAMDHFTTDPRVGVANPNWRMPDGYSSAQAEADESGPGWFKGYGFADQVFLCRRSRFSRPLLQRWIPLAISCPVSTRYPGRQVCFGQSTLFFEQIVDAFMRRQRILRLTLTSREFEPVPSSVYVPIGLEERLSAKLARGWLKTFETLSSRFPEWLTSPRLRTGGLLNSSQGSR